MILRVYRATAAGDARALLLAHVRDQVYPANVRTPGLRTFQTGIASGKDDSLELVLVSTWDDFDALRQAIGDDSLHPHWLRDIADALTPRRADHYELIGEELAGVVPLAGGALRILSGRLAQRGGETFFEFARRVQAAQLDAGDILVSHIGRRMVQDREEAVYVTVWRDAEAASAAGVYPGDRELLEAYFESSSVAAYNALVRVVPKAGDSSIVLLADDDRRYLFASAGAGRLLGRAPARLLGRRVEDLAAPSVRGNVQEMWTEFLREGTQAGSFPLARADGSIAALRYEARANTPWPGVHASVLTDPSAPVEFDEALATAGIVARYAVASSR